MHPHHCWCTPIHWMWKTWLIGALEVDFVHFCLDLVHLMPPWDSKPPIFQHPCMCRCNNWPKSYHPCLLSNLWLFGFIRGMIGPPMGDWCQFWNFDLYTHIGLPKPHKTFQMYYKPYNNMFCVRQLKINLVMFTCVCVNCFSINGFCTKFDLWVSLMLLDSPVVQIYHIIF